MKTRQSVDVDETRVTKTSYTNETSGGKTQTRYALRGEYDGRRLTKFVSKVTFDGYDVPVE